MTLRRFLNQCIPVGTSHYDEYDECGRIVFGVLAIGTITAPIWLPPWLLWWVCTGKKQAREADERFIEQQRLHAKATVRQAMARPPAKPITFSSIHAKQEWENSVRNHQPKPTETP